MYTYIYIYTLTQKLLVKTKFQNTLPDKKKSQDTHLHTYTEKKITKWNPKPLTHTHNKKIIKDQCAVKQAKMNTL